MEYEAARATIFSHLERSGEPCYYGLDGVAFYGGNDLEAQADPQHECQREPDKPGGTPAELGEHHEAHYYGDDIPVMTLAERFEKIGVSIVPP